MVIIKIIFASQNKSKVLELSAILKPYHIKLKSISDFTSTSPKENGKTFEENALLKARWAMSYSQDIYSSLADDSGLCIKNLNDSPGIHSARWSINKSYNQIFSEINNKFNNLGLKMNNQPAEFICVIAYINKKKEEYLYKGSLKGTMTFPPKGKGGFGYDPIFKPLNSEHTLAEMSSEYKNNISHRKLALDKFITDNSLLVT